ncbi:hypothetical protein BBK36DRAFT_1181693 [Trichoderma citrinoviride]|uniref:Uncharacterized protein n=1 Tax=Trichoderma citrinoviride TaxID=58853 RepID=A0A2T4B2B5_9HYPO|nr:hypothetical protein BBK36DRAFT_1181693 [Trichoderma citrinoviride]PTB63351.1 hypothetical protein BBK36DRAFT_1181693 [Trichoderma citrinoviride]
MTKSNRLPKQNHHRSRAQRRDDNNYINSRHFIQTSKQEPASDSHDSSEYDTCSGYESAPGYDSSLENSSEYDPFYGCGSSSGVPSSFGSRAASPDSESSQVQKERLAQNTKSKAAADSKEPKSNASAGAASSTTSKPSTTSFAPVGASAFSSSGLSKK